MQPDILSVKKDNGGGFGEPFEEDYFFYDDRSLANTMAKYNFRKMLCLFLFPSITNRLRPSVIIRETIFTHLHIYFR